MTQPQIDAVINAAISKYTNPPGQFVADQQGNYVGECLSLVKKIWGDILHVQMPGAVNGYNWGDGYWKYFFSSLPLPTYFNFIEKYQPGFNYPKGSMVMYAATHHIALWLKDNGDGTHQVFEQNADPDHSPAHIGNRSNSRVTGIVTPKIEGESMPYTDEQYNSLKADRDNYAEDWAREYYLLAGVDPNKVGEAERKARVAWTFIDAKKDLEQKLPVADHQTPYELKQQGSADATVLKPGNYKVS